MLENYTKDEMHEYFTDLVKLLGEKKKEYGFSNDLSGQILSCCLPYFIARMKRGPQIKMLVNVIDKLARIVMHMDLHDKIHQDSIDDMIVYLTMIRSQEDKD